MIFVFGSNQGGFHGAGAAEHAYIHEGAVWGKGEGHYGNSYAIPTKDYKVRTLAIWRILGYIQTFIKYAKDHPELEFNVTRIGCGLAGYVDEDIAPLFDGAPSNCHLPVKGEHDCPESWRDIIESRKRPPAVGDQSGPSSDRAEDIGSRRPLEAGWNGSSD